MQKTEASFASSISAIYLIERYSLVSFVYIRMFIEKQAFKCLFKIPLQHENDNTAFYFLTFLVKIWSENSISIPIHYGIIYLWIWLLGGATYQGGKETEEGKGALMSNLCLISHRWYDVEKFAVPEGKSEISVQKLGLFIQSSYSLTLFPAETIAMK